VKDDDHERLSKKIRLLKETLAQREREMDALKVNNLFLGALFDGITEEIMVVDPDFNIKDANKTFLNQYGVKREDVVGRKCHEVKEHSDTPCSLKEGDCPLEQARKSGQIVEITRFHRDPEGKTKELNMSMYPLRPEGEDIAYFIEITRDITEYKELIGELHASEKKFRAILDTATDGIVSIDANQRIILFNNAAERIFGYSRKEILGENLNILIPQHYGDHSRFVHRFLENRESEIIGKTISITGLRRGEEEFPIQLSLSFIELGGKPTFTAIIRDVSDQRHMERKLLQSERLAAVGQAVAHVSHELKNPLMIIGGFSTQIRKGLGQGKEATKLDMILDEVKRLERLVADLGDFTKTYTLVKRQTHINSVVKDVINIMSEVRLLDDYDLHQDLSEEVQEIICDPDKLKQVFINVISNGLEAMEEGGLITVSSRSIDNGIEVRISDDGPGIPGEDLEHIFEPFYTTRKKGSGLGLSISFKIVEAHRGDISAISRPGQGTTFIIRLPNK